MSFLAHRPSKDEYFMDMALLVSERSTCLRRKVGAVLINKRKHVLATGYNGVASGQPHCLDIPCIGANSASGTDLDLCEAVHAEQNALLQCRNVFEIDTCYVTVSPCMTCTKLLLNTSCQTIIFEEDYVDQKARLLWERHDRKWVRIDGSFQTH
jgi:dCMP deaminase